jgi:Lectin C-type domain
MDTSLCPRKKLKLLQFCFISVHRRYNYSLFGVTFASAYAAYFTKPLNYTDAQSTCQSMNSRLFVAKSMERFALFKSIGDDDFDDWIGLDDMVTEGHFVWADDGQELDTFMKSYLFRAPQPDNSKGIEDCVYKRAASESPGLTLNDAQCSLLLTYICENLHC